jgi:hypothetical protein
MTAKEFVQSKRPNAFVEKGKMQDARGNLTNYWLVMVHEDFSYIASGKSESNAWVNAKKAIIEHNL